MKKAKLFVSIILLLGVITACSKTYSIDDIKTQNGLTITRVEERTINMAFNKVDIPNDFKDIITFEKNEILGFRTETSYIYLESITYDENKPEYYILNFNTSYYLDKGNYVTVPYYIEDQTYQFTAKLKFHFVDDGFDLYDNALYMHGNGSDEKFAVAIKKDVYQKAHGIISFTMDKFYDLTYVAV